MILSTVNPSQPLQGTWIRCRSDQRKEKSPPAVRVGLGAVLADVGPGAHFAVLAHLVAGFVAALRKVGAGELGVGNAAEGALPGLGLGQGVGGGLGPLLSLARVRVVQEVGVLEEAPAALVALVALLVWKTGHNDKVDDEQTTIQVIKLISWAIKSFMSLLTLSKVR